MADHGKYTFKAARHKESGGLQQASDGSIRSASEIYEVMMPAGTEYIDPTQISDLPVKDSLHPKYSTLYVRDYSWQHVDEGSLLWRCTVSYEVRSGSTHEGDDVERVVSLEWGSSSGQTDVVTDAKLGLPVVNSAGDLFDTVPTMEEVYPTVHLVQHERRHRTQVLALNGKVNRAAFTVAGITFQPHTCRLRVTCRKLLDQTDLPYEYDYTFEGRNHPIKTANAAWLNGTAINGYAATGDLSDIGWDVELVQAGFRYLDDGTPTKFLDTNADGGQSEPALPHPLDEFGMPLAPGEPLRVLVVRAYPDADFSILRVPPSA